MGCAAGESPSGIELPNGVQIAPDGKRDGGRGFGIGSIAQELSLNLSVLEFTELTVSGTSRIQVEGSEALGHLDLVLFTPFADSFTVSGALERDDDESVLAQAPAPDVEWEPNGDSPMLLFLDTGAGFDFVVGETTTDGQENPSTVFRAIKVHSDHALLSSIDPDSGETLQYRRELPPGSVLGAALLPDPISAYLGAAVKEEIFEYRYVIKAACDTDEGCALDGPSAD